MKNDKKEVTLGLAVITNNAKDTIRLVSTYADYFDTFYITVADKDKLIYFKLKEAFSENDKVKLSYFKWVDHFGKARRFNQKQIKTDYWFWMDTDDAIDRPENIPKLMSLVQQQDIDALYLNYDYYQNEHGEQQANHPRERLLKTSAGYEWANVPCHETVITGSGNIQKSELVSIKHHKTIADMEASMKRNQTLLEKDWEKTKDPRTAFYLGTTYEYQKRYDKSVEMFTYLIKNGGWDEQKVIAWNHIADCFYFTELYDKALQATDAAIHMDPTHPDAYFQKILIYSAANQLDKACEWAEVAMTKKPKEDSMQLQDPTRYTYKGIFLAAQANLFLGRIQRAWELYRQVMEVAPHFLDEVNRETKTDWNKQFSEAFIDEKAINYTKFLSRYFKDYGGNPELLFKALPKKLFSDIRLNAERVVAIPPKKWPAHSVAIFCGAGHEDWGPENVNQGIGGSEEAVIYLSRELAKLGWDITVFCERQDDYKDHVSRSSVVYKPWTEFNPWDEFDVFVAWRQPQNARGIKARRKLVDLHDTIPEQLAKEVVDEVDQFMVKSRYHRSLYPSIPDNKITIIGNGVVQEQFV